jgi:hypothetical protein
MAELDSFPNQQPQDSDEVVAAHDSNGDGTLDDTVNWTWGSMKDALDSAGFARLTKDETITGNWDIDFINSQIEFSGDTHTWKWVVGDSWNGVADGRFLLWDDDNDREVLTADTSGNVGIRTNSPDYTFDTAGDIRAQDKLLTDFSDPTEFSAREVKSGTGAPSDSEGKNGDIYIQTN